MRLCSRIAKLLRNYEFTYFNFQNCLDVVNLHKIIIRITYNKHTILNNFLSERNISKISDVLAYLFVRLYIQVNDFSGFSRHCYMHSEEG